MEKENKMEDAYEQLMLAIVTRLDRVIELLEVMCKPKAIVDLEGVRALQYAVVANSLQNSAHQQPSVGKDG